MTKRNLATALAVSLALTSVAAAPARAADSGEVGRFLLGAGALIILTHELSRQNRGKVTRRYVDPGHYRRDYDRDDYREYKYKRDRLRRDRGHYNRNHKIVPFACLRENRFRDGPRRYFGERCLWNNMRNANRLPGTCRTSVWSRHGWRTVYSAYCLRKKGWSIG